MEVPLQVWDVENNRQLMVSFRDQADDGTFNLIEYNLHFGDRDGQSYEKIFIHKYEYDEGGPRPEVALNGGVVYGLLHEMHPYLQPGATWDPANLNSQMLTIRNETIRGVLRGSNPSYAPEVHVDHHAIVPMPIDPISKEYWILNANDGGVALSTDKGWTYTELDHPGSGYNTTQFYGVSKKPGSPNYAGGAQDNGSWVSPLDPDASKGWGKATGGDGFATVWHATDPNRMLVTAQGTIYRSDDGGQTISDFESLGNVDFVVPLSTSDNAPDNVYSTTLSGVVRTQDFGETWTLVRLPNPAWGSGNGKVSVSIADPDIVWAGKRMDVSNGTKLFVSDDRGESFSTVPYPSVPRPPNTQIFDLATHPTESHTAYVLFSRFGHAKVLQTRDLGQTWTDLSGFDSSGVSSRGFPDVAIYDLLVMPHDTKVLWAGTEIGLFQSTDNGRNWHYAANGLPAVSVWEMKIRDNEAILATHGRGVWTVPLGEVKTAIDQAPGEFPTSFSLGQNNPNPFNASTTINFTVGVQADIRIAVFDVTGRRVTMLADQVYAPGEYELHWDARTHPSGVYFYRMESGGRLIQNRKMTLLK